MTNFGWILALAVIILFGLFGWSGVFVPIAVIGGIFLLAIYRNHLHSRGYTIRGIFRGILFSIFVAPFLFLKGFFLSKSFFKAVGYFVLAILCFTLPAILPMIFAAIL